ncbi:ATP-binding cassette sub-family A member 3 [Araneus ventricosus]|uniref:ATP-binding cassette sub-family A member 3 n=1 Tax=Araneus ventricosus TaxID=182803 RepID=A0A4Y2TP93_ARAVE|nr:ATP-binding cassette sub-family A member 3 [Araneus ventricosus]
MFVPVDSGICCFQQLSFNRVSAVTCCPLGDLMKMMGMTDFTYWSSTFLNYFVIALITVPIITIAYKATLKNGTALLKHSDGGLVFLILLLFMISLILFCMTFSIFFNRAVFAIIVLLVVYILSFTLLSVKLLDPFNESAYFSMSVISKLGICLFPQTALVTAIFLISSYEASGEGVHWSNISEFALLPEVNLLMVILTMLFSCFLYVFLLWYFDGVWPWQPGVPRPFYFFLTSSYWCGGRPKQLDEIELVQSENNVEFFETEPSNISRGVVIKNLSKEFRSGLTSKLAVNNVSLNIYQGQITALLGHNGAGKTTTINILTGLFTPTSGGAYINGLDILTDTTKARRGLGVCPQHNVLFDTLTVDEHLKIYAAMKGVPWSQLAAEATKALDILKLSDKRYELAKSLSGGMKRKLSLAIAVIGGSKNYHTHLEEEYANYRKPPDGARIVRHNDESVREGYIRNGGKEVKLFTSVLKAFQCNNRIVMAQRKHLDDFLRGRIIGRLECGRTQLEVSEELGIAQSFISRLWQRFQDDDNVSRRYSTGRPRVTTPNEDWYLAVTAKRNRRTTASDLSRQLSSATGTTVSRQTVYRRLGHIGLYARRPVRCVPLNATHCRLRLA